jgi:hypothetical protein
MSHCLTEIFQKNFYTPLVFNSMGKSCVYFIRIRQKYYKNKLTKFIFML